MRARMLEAVELAVLLLRYLMFRPCADATCSFLLQEHPHLSGRDAPARVTSVCREGPLVSGRLWGSCYPCDLPLCHREMALQKGCCFSSGLARGGSALEVVRAAGRRPSL